MLPAVATVFQAISETRVESAATPKGTRRGIQLGSCVSALLVPFGYADLDVYREDFNPNSTWVKNP